MYVCGLVLFVGIGITLRQANMGSAMQDLVVREAVSCGEIRL